MVVVINFTFILRGRNSPGSTKNADYGSWAVRPVWSSDVSPSDKLLDALPAPTKYDPGTMGLCHGAGSLVSRQAEQWYQSSGQLDNRQLRSIKVTPIRFTRPYWWMKWSFPVYMLSFGTAELLAETELPAVFISRCWNSFTRKQWASCCWWHKVFFYFSVFKIFLLTFTKKNLIICQQNFHPFKLIQWGRKRDSNEWAFLRPGQGFFYVREMAKWNEK